MLQVFFVCASVVSCVAFVISLFVLHLSCGASKGLCFVIVAIPGYLQLYFCYCLFLNGTSFSVPGRMCFEIVAFPG